jgi:hypothetical protein
VLHCSQHGPEIMIGPRLDGSGKIVEHRDVLQIRQGNPVFQRALG